MDPSKSNFGWPEAAELEPSPSSEKAFAYERVRRLLAAVEPRFADRLADYSSRSRDDFVRQWPTIFGKKGFSFRDLPEADATQFYGCSMDERFRDESVGFLASGVALGLSVKRDTHSKSLIQTRAIDNNNKYDIKNHDFIVTKG